MSTVLRQSTQIVVRVGPFVDVTDGFTPETGVALSTADEAEVLKAAGAATVDISAATWAAITGADGWYDLTLTTSHTDTVGELVIVVNDDSVCLPVFARFQVIEEAAYDQMFAAAAPGAASVAALATVDTNVDAILVDTAEIGAAGAGLTEAGGTGDHLTAVPWNAAWDSEVESECNDAIVANHLDHLLAATYDPASKPGTADALLNELIEQWLDHARQCDHIQNRRMAERQKGWDLERVAMLRKLAGITTHIGTQAGQDTMRLVHKILCRALTHRRFSYSFP